MKSRQVELTEQWHDTCQRRCSPPHLAVDHIRQPQRPIGAELGGAAVYEGAVAKDDLIAVARRRACRWKFSSTVQAEWRATREHAWKHCMHCCCSSKQHTRRLSLARSVPNSI